MPPFLLPDISESYRVADRIARHADAVRTAAGTLAAAIAHDRWRGIAADVFSIEATSLLRDMRAAAERLDDAADALRRHSGRVDALLARAGRIVDDVVGAGAVAVHDVARAVDAGLSVVGL
jgi:uncharacterized protein YukE